MTEFLHGQIDEIVSDLQAPTSRHQTRYPVSWMIGQQVKSFLGSMVFSRDRSSRLRILLDVITECLKGVVDNDTDDEYSLASSSD